MRLESFKDQLAEVLKNEPALTLSEHTRRLQYFNSQPEYHEGRSRDDMMEGNSWEITESAFVALATRHNIYKPALKKFRMAVPRSKLLSVYERRQDGSQLLPAVYTHTFERE